MMNQITPDLVGALQFEVINIFDKAQLKTLGKFDVIFSRNMLIYFDDASKKEVAMNFYDMLNPGGHIFLGHAEYMNRITPIFKPKKDGTTLYYQK
jgi:chemotaxis protein methyltransferase CheR